MKLFLRLRPIKMQILLAALIAVGLQLDKAEGKDRVRLEASSDCHCDKSKNSNSNLPNSRSIVEKAAETDPHKPLSYAAQLQSFFKVGERAALIKVHGLWRRRTVCWRSVWETLKAAHLVKGNLSQAGAKDAYKDLKKFGFHDVMKTSPQACLQPGVIRVYGPARPGSIPRHAKRTKGDTYGHIEIVGTDGRFHHFTSSSTPMNSRSHFGPQRRPLIQCLIKGKG